MILNGIGVPRMDIYYEGAIVEQIILQRCNIEGLQNQLGLDELRHTTANGKRHQKLKGFHYTFILSYPGLIFSEELDKFRRIFNYKQAGAELFLIPHVDEASLRYEVNISQGITFAYDIANNEAGQGFQGVSFAFDTVDRINQITFIIPDGVSTTTMETMIAI